MEVRLIRLKAGGSIEVTNVIEMCSTFYANFFQILLIS